MVDELGGDREVAVVRELTKLHEEVFRGTAGQALAHFEQDRVRGEIVLLFGAGTRTTATGNGARSPATLAQRNRSAHAGDRQGSGPTVWTVRQRCL